MKTFITIFLILLIKSSFGQLSQSGYSDFMLGTSLSLGRGYNPKTPDIAYTSPYTFDYDTLDGKGSLLTTIDFSLASTKSELK